MFHLTGRVKNPLITLRVPKSDVGQLPEEDSTGPSGPEFHTDSLKDKVKSHITHSDDESSDPIEENGIVRIRMRKSEYQRWFAVDEEGFFKDGVTDPPGGRPTWLAKRVEDQKSSSGKSISKLFSPKGVGSDSGPVTDGAMF